MVVSLAAVVLAYQLVAASGASSAASIVPEFNVDPTCRAAAAAGLVGGRTFEACKRDELEARSQIGQQWTQFPAEEKSRCRALTTMGGEPSYVEMLTCLEMARDVRNLRNSETTGQIRR